MAGEASSIEHAVRDVASDFLKDAAGPPTDLHRIGERLGVESIQVLDLPFSGELRREKGKLAILLSTHLTPSRRRFTIAHELGHAILETTGPRCPKSGSELERLCDMLATELLMPTDTFRRMLPESVSISDIWQLARTFKTSITATAIRLGEMRECTVFEVQGDWITWSYGEIRKGPVSSVESDVQDAINNSKTIRSGDTTVFLWNRIWKGQWNLQWHPIVQSERTLFLAQPQRT